MAYKKSYPLRPGKKERIDMWKEEAEAREISLNKLIILATDKEVRRKKK